MTEYDYQNYEVVPTDPTVAPEVVGPETLGVFAFLGGVWLLVMLAVFVFMVICMWKIFTKAGKPGWAAIIPIYNYIVLLEVVGRPIWWILALFASFIPFVGWIIALAVNIIVSIDLAKSFGKSAGFGIIVALFPIVGYPILAFGKDTYSGPAAGKNPVTSQS